MKRALLLLLPLLTACGHLETHQAMFRAPEPPTGPEAVLYMADQPPPPRAYYEIALLQAIGFGNEAHPEIVAHALAAKGAALGCDAVIRTFLDQGYSKANASGVCVKWAGPPIQVVAPLPPSPVPVAPSPAGEQPPATQPAPPPASTMTNPPPPPQPPSQQMPAPAPKMEPLPSADPSQGGGR